MNHKRHRIDVLSAFPLTDHYCSSDTRTYETPDRGKRHFSFSCDVSPDESHIILSTNSQLCFWKQPNATHCFTCKDKALKEDEQFYKRKGLVEMRRNKKMWYGVNINKLHYGNAQPITMRHIIMYSLYISIKQQHKIIV